MNNVSDAEWYWYRFEYQARGSIHAHGCAKLKNDPDLRLLGDRVCEAFKENNLPNNDIEPDKCEFSYQEVIQQGEDAELLIQ